MTTIAYDGNMLAADSRIVFGDYICPNNVIKLRKIGNIVYGIAGFYAWFDEWIAWYIAGANPYDAPAAKFNNKEGGEFLVLDDLQLKVCTTSIPCFLPISGPDAWGSGGQYAIGAMLAGSSAFRAVELAAIADPYTAGSIIAFDRHDLAQEK